MANVHPHGPSRSVAATGYVVPRKRASLDGLVTVKAVRRSRVTSGPVCALPPDDREGRPGGQALAGGQAVVGRVGREPVAVLLGQGPVDLDGVLAGVERPGAERFERGPLRGAPLDGDAGNESRVRGHEQIAEPPEVRMRE